MKGSPGGIFRKGSMVACMGERRNDKRHKPLLSTDTAEDDDDVDDDKAAAAAAKLFPPPPVVAVGVLVPVADSDPPTVPATTG